MFRNQYDTDVTTWSPSGKLHQVEYAMEAVKQGSAVVGCVSSTHAVLTSLLKSQSDLAAHQRKLYKIDEHVGVGLSGLIADGRVLTKFMRNQCQNHKFVFDSSLPVSRLVHTIADKSQKSTQFASGRPFGVGFLVAGYDRTGPHLYQTCPSGNLWEYHAMAIGARAQSAKTYLEKNFESFPNASVDVLIRHALLALRETAGNSELTADNVSLAIVGRDTPFTFITGPQLKSFIDSLEAAEGAQAMET
eukprot:c12277_g1_i2.p1 GENE.c12277_g1_i2~~c12277_g1_i2.p1  ORF type:complete len:247 (+),score=46.91 c12277_g1_i2:38-778(+)